MVKPVSGYWFTMKWNHKFIRLTLGIGKKEKLNEVIYLLSLNNSEYWDFLRLIYPNQLEIKDTTDTVKSASYLDLHLEIDMTHDHHMCHKD